MDSERPAENLFSNWPNNKQVTSLLKTRKAIALLKVSAYDNKLGR